MRKVMRVAREVAVDEITANRHDFHENPRARARRWGERDDEEKESRKGGKVAINDDWSRRRERY